MRLKMLFALLALAATPTLAEGCRHGNVPRITASSCGEGQVWDIITETCIAATSS
jgi:hypothetical protein